MTGTDPAGKREQPPEPAVRADYLDLIRSDRVSTQTRRALLARAEPVAPAAGVLDEPAWAVLRAVIDRALPQPGPERLDLAARVVAGLDEGGDGWRFADLPPDALALPAGLRTLAEAALAETGRPFPELDGVAQDGFLARVARGDLGEAGEARPGRLSRGAMTRWFEDLRSAAVRCYVAHPATLARIGYSGVANGGDGSLGGFARVGRGQTEPWEPPSEKDLSR